jgi:branched-chain amino acid transport system permease protein
MTWALVFEQLLNGLQYGVMLFLMAGRADARARHHEHGEPRARLAVHGRRLPRRRAHRLDRELLSPAWRSPCSARCSSAWRSRSVALRALYNRDHLDQVLATFGLILFFNELISMIWGRGRAVRVAAAWLQGHIELFTGSRYPVLPHFAILLVGLVHAILLWYVVTRTRLGMLVRAGASNRTMVGALGVNIKLLYTVVFGVGAALAGLAGLMAGPIYAVQPAWASSS